jgi:hypothetical protein
MRCLIPLYSYPLHDASCAWQRVAAAARATPAVAFTAVINPDSGPAPAGLDAEYRRGVRLLRAAGVTLLGYVSTAYARRPLAAVRRDIDRYHADHEVDGIFLDEVPSDDGPLGHYRQLYRHSKRLRADAIVVANPGTQIAERYLTAPAADLAVVFESGSSAWRRYRPDDYLARHDAARFACLVHGTRSARVMWAHLRRARARHIGHVFVTDGSPWRGDRNPWNRLPPYWDEQVAALAALAGDRTVRLPPGDRLA